MGLIEKAITKNRIKPKDAPANLPAPYLFRGNLAVARVTRSAMFALAQKGDLTSSAHRGRDTLGIGSSMNSGASTLWFSELNDRTWDVSLGLDGVRGKAIDWTVRLQVSDDASSVAITTPAVLTKDGTQVHRKQYQDFIDLAQTGLASGNPPASDSEIAATNATLEAGGIPVVSTEDGFEHQDRSWTTMLSIDEIEAMLHSVPFPVAQTEPGALVIATGLDPQDEQRHGKVSAIDEGAHRRVRYSADMPLTGSIVTDTITVRRAIAAGELVGIALQAFDPDSHEETLAAEHDSGGTPATGDGRTSPNHGDAGGS
jgi:hypothetical protein